MFDRKRKTKDPCPGCFLHRTLCICDLIPRLEFKTKVTVVVHAKELKRTTNTGRLAVKALVNSELRVRGEGRLPLDLSAVLSPQYTSFIFFPGPQACELTPELVRASAKPIHLIVPDGNWRQASKVQSRHPEFKDLMRVQITRPNLARVHLRAESSAQGMSTLQAIAEALSLIEGDEAARPLQTLYQAKLRNTLRGRGQA